MILIHGHNPMGNVLHMLVGPETEMFQDIHGAKIMDITEVIKNSVQAESTYISLTRCKSEALTEAMLKASNVPYRSSFTGISEGNATVGSKPVEAQVESKAKETCKEKCTYCKRETTLLPIPGFKICTVCAQIELGQLKSKKAKDTPHV